MVTIILFSLALSLDGFGVGLSYGMRKVKIAFFSYVIICLSSAIAVLISMALGNVLELFLPVHITTLVGALILITVGAWTVLQSYFLNIIPEKKSYQITIPNLGIVINILKEPTQADFDQSGIIDTKEAFFLGMALAMDALGAGFGAAMTGYSILWTPIFIAVAKFFLVSLGLTLGRRYLVGKVKGEVSLLPGGIIILLGLSKLLSI